MIIVERYWQIPLRFQYYGILMDFVILKWCNWTCLSEVPAIDDNFEDVYIETIWLNWRLRSFCPSVYPHPNPNFTHLCIENQMRARRGLFHQGRFCVDQEVAICLDSSGQVFKCQTWLLHMFRNLHTSSWEYTSNITARSLDPAFRVNDPRPLSRCTNVTSLGPLSREPGGSDHWCSGTMKSHTGTFLHPNMFVGSMTMWTDE